MGKPTGFIDYVREAAAEAEPQQRIRHWQEFHQHWPEDDLRQQAVRNCRVWARPTGKHQEPLIKRQIGCASMRVQNQPDAAGSIHPFAR